MLPSLHVPPDVALSLRGSDHFEPSYFYFYFYFYMFENPVNWPACRLTPPNPPFALLSLPPPTGTERTFTASTREGKVSWSDRMMRRATAEGPPPVASAQAQQALLPPTPATTTHSSFSSTTGGAGGGAGGGAAGGSASRDAFLGTGHARSRFFVCRMACVGYTMDGGLRREVEVLRVCVCVCVCVWLNWMLICSRRLCDL